MTLSIKNGGYAFFDMHKTRFNFFYVFMEVVPIVINFKQPFFLSVKHLIKLILDENDVKLLKFKRSPVKVDL